MEIVFKSANIKKQSEDHKVLRRQYGNQQAVEIVARINELDAAESLHDIRKLPYVRFHALSGNFKGCFALYLKSTYRMVISPLNGDTDDLKTVTRVYINRLCIDYH